MSHIISNYKVLVVVRYIALLKFLPQKTFFFINYGLAEGTLKTTSFYKEPQFAD